MAPRVGKVRLLCGTTFSTRPTPVEEVTVLAPVGGRIVTDVLVGLVDADATSFRQNSRDRQPQKTLVELLAC